MQGNKQLSFIKAILHHRDTNPLGSLRPNDVCQQKENQWLKWTKQGDATFSEMMLMVLKLHLIYCNNPAWPALRVPQKTWAH